ncbi:MAG: hypothetical protein A2342_05885 [Gallionellales bacterium RIFOXYB12_FULL_54_9]|nr:MAG: hypothetical protein A2342_05885 [Gallionellales bacterium RIFOXYB12_FULL_54_9]
MMKFELHDGALRAKDGDWSFRISTHWTGEWLDGWLLSRQMIPVKFTTVEKAKEYARQVAGSECHVTMLDQVAHDAI